MDDVLSAAVVANLSQYPFWTDEVEAAIRRDVGDTGLALVHEAHRFAADQKDLWINLPYGAAFESTRKRVQSRYPQFTTEAVKCIATLAAYDWK